MYDDSLAHLERQRADLFKQSEALAATYQDNRKALDRLQFDRTRVDLALARTEAAIEGLLALRDPERLQTSARAKDAAERVDRYQHFLGFQPAYEAARDEVIVDEPYEAEAMLNALDGPVPRAFAEDAHVLERAKVATTIARRMLSGSPAEALVEDQALALMALPLENLTNLLARMEQPQAEDVAREEFDRAGDLDKLCLTPEAAAGLAERNARMEAFSRSVFEKVAAGYLRDAQAEDDDIDPDEP